MAMVGVSIILLILNRFYRPPGTYGFPGSDALGAIGFATVGLVIGSRRPKNVIGWLFGAMGVGHAASELTRQYAIHAQLLHPGALPAGTLVAWLQTAVVFFPVVAALPLLFLLFPDGRFLSRRWRPIAWIGIAGVTASFVSFALKPGPLNDMPMINNPFGLGTNPRPWAVVNTLGFAIWAASILAGLASLVQRFRRSRRDERQQIKWVALAAVFFAIVFLIALGFFGPTGTVPIWVDLLLTASFVMIAATAAIALLKYRLYEIDLVINRAVVYGVLAAFITVTYLAVVSGLGSVIARAGQPSPVLSVIATAAIAVAFQPVRGWAQKLANRLVYGEKATPYEVLSRFSKQVEEALSSEELVQRMAAALGRGIDSERAEVWLRIAGELRREASWPETLPFKVLRMTGEQVPQIPGADLAVPVYHHENLLGMLAVKKRRGEQFTPTEERLIGDLARHAGLALRNVALRRLDDLFGRHVGEDVARRAIEQGVQLGGELREASALFVDLVNSTGLAESRSPSEMVMLLNDLFDMVVKCVHTEEGLVNKFEGDAALCIFGVPVERKDHKMRALRAARRMRSEILRLRSKHPDIDVGIGVSSGLVIAGNVGAERRYEYTVIGDPVNEAARLTEVAKERASRLVASANTQDRAEEEASYWKRSDEIVLRGRSRPTTIFEPTAIPREVSENLQGVSGTDRAQETVDPR
jgi:class 3 adenylate cyclase